MKTGRDANHSGVYVSECCEKELHFPKGQMLPRCPRCNSLTVWELEEQEYICVSQRPSSPSDGGQAH